MDEVMKKYGDILDHPRYVSPTRRPMSMLDRAAQFSPFAALTGFEGQIGETARFTEEKPELSEEAQANIGQTLSEICFKGLPREVKLTVFIPDGRKNGGSIETDVVTVKKADPAAGTLTLVSGKTVRFTDILEIADVQN